MIKIDSKKAEDTAEIFYEAVKPYVCIRLNFIIELLVELEKGNVKLEAFKKEFCEECKNYKSFKKIDAKTIKPLINPMLKSSFKGEKIADLEAEDSDILEKGNVKLEAFKKEFCEECKDYKSFKKIDINTIKSLINPMLKSSFKGKKIADLEAEDSDIFDVKDSNGNKKGRFFYEKVRKGKDDKEKVIYEETYLEIKKAKEFFENVKSNLKEVITGNPEKLSTFKGNDKGIGDDIYNVQKYVFIKEIIEKIFNYEHLKDGFSINNDELKTLNQKTFTSYDLTSRLGLSVCVYCNRNWIMTVTKKMDKKGKFKVTNPQLDHFFSKSEFPLLRLSFYNLIPSCETCNARLKKAVEFKYNKNLHPYCDGYMNNAKFVVSPKSYEAAIGKAADYKVGIDIINKDLEKQIENNHDTFKINEIYEKHGDIISEIYRKKYVYNEKYLEKLKGTFSIKVSNQELYKLLLNNYITEEDFHKRPFALLIHDLTKDLGMI